MVCIQVQGDTRTWLIQAGLFLKTVRVIQDMPCSDYSIIWHTLLGACQIWADVNVVDWHLNGQ